MRRSLAFALIAALALIGCGEEDDNVAVCSALCECGSIVPLEYNRCMSECTREVRDDVPPACSECVLTASCAELLHDTCDVEC
jgi:hypothetical protein